MVRRIGFLMVLMVALAGAQALALGLGEITLHSALNQKLDAEVDLLEADDLSAEEILPSLASSVDFERVGVERFFFLTDLRFAVETKPNGRKVLRITSRQPITEPYLNFLVEVRWPNGRLLREYTVLLDPPTFSAKPAPAVAVPRRSDPGGGGAGRVERSPVNRPDSHVSLSPQPQVTSPASTNNSTSPGASTSSQNQPELSKIQDGKYGVTDRSDTLWAIAAKTRPSSSVSVQQNMLALQRLNPEAFIKGNINLLKAGYVLRLPSEAEALSLSTTQATAEVAQHNRDWNAYRSGGSIVDRSQPSVVAEQTQPGLKAQLQSNDSGPGQPEQAASTGGELRIVSDASDSLGNGGTGDSPLATELAASQEERERLAREKDEAVYQLDRLAAQEEQTKRQLEVKDQQVAQLQQQLKQAQEQLAAAGTAAAQRKPTNQPPAGGSEIMKLLQSPLVLGGGALVIVAGLALLMISARRRRSESEEEFTYTQDTHQDTQDGHVEPSLGMDSEASDFDEEVFQEDDAEAAQEFDDSEAPPEMGGASTPENNRTAQTTDVIGEADIYIAYNRYPQAVALLLGALEDDPDRSEVRLKLLEVYAETQDRDGFEKNLAELVERCDDDEILLHARELEAQLNQEENLDLDAAQIADAPVEESSGSVDEFDLSLDEDSLLNSATPEDSGQAEASVSEEDFTLELDTDPSRSSDAQSRTETAEHTQEQTAGELGGDLGLDFNPDSDVTQIRSTPDAGVESATEMDLDFDLDGLDLEDSGDVAVENSTEVATASEEAFDFLDEQDTASTKLDLARAYIDMGDEDGARDILTEVIQEGSEVQQEKAGELLQKLG